MWARMRMVSAKLKIIGNLCRFSLPGYRAPEHLLVGGTMKLSTSLLPVAAILSLAASLISAVPAQAAVALPAGCTTPDSRASKADVYEMECKTLANGVDLSSFTNLQFLTIGMQEAGRSSKVALTALPKVPASVVYLEINAPKLTNYSGLSAMRNLRHLDITSPTKYLNLSRVATWNPKLEGLYVRGFTTAINAAPLAKLKNLQYLELLGSLPNLRLNEGTWTRVAFPKGLNGQAILPPNSNYMDENGKILSKKEYNFDAKTSKMRANSASFQAFTSSYRSEKPTAAQPKLRYAQIAFTRSLDVAGLSEWARDKKMKLQVRGGRDIGQTATAQLSDTSNPFKAYIDAYQWYRNGKAIKGATKSSYKLTRADLGKRITIKATDNKDELAIMAFRTVPYSVTATVTPKAQYGFKTRKPSIVGTPRAGKQLKAKFTKWSGSPSRYSYQWYRNGKAIKGATKVTYKVVNADKGRKLTVKLTGTKKNYHTASSTCAARTVT